MIYKFYDRNNNLLAEVKAATYLEAVGLVKEKLGYVPLKYTVG